MPNPPIHEEDPHLDEDTINLPPVNEPVKLSKALGDQRSSASTRITQSFRTPAFSIAHVNCFAWLINSCCTMSSVNACAISTSGR